MYGENIRKDNTEEDEGKSEYWTSTEYDERVLDYWRLPNREYIFKLKQDDGFEYKTDIENSMPAHSCSFFN